MRKLLLLLLFVPMICFAQTDSLGIYFKTDEGLQRIEAIKSTGLNASTKGALLTGGIAKVKTKSVYRGAQSENVVNSDTEFYLYFSKPKGFLNNPDAQAFVHVQSPKDLVVLEFRVINKKNKKHRELTAASVGAYSGASTGLEETDKIQIKYTKIREGVYKATFVGDVPSGEYCFSSATGAGMMPVFDFSVPKE